MKKVLFQFITMVILFFATWGILSSVDWKAIFRVEHTTGEIETKIGDLLWKSIKERREEIFSPAIVLPVDSLLIRICEKNNIDKTKIKPHILKNDEVNAFAFPDNYLILYRGLLESCRNEAELSGVLCHEIAHMEQNHVMKKIVKEFGLAILVTLSSGSGGPGVLSEVLRTLSSVAYDRKLESEADRIATDYLIRSDIDPEPFANFMYRLSLDKGKIPKQMYWVSTHPDPEERAKEIIDYIKDKEINKVPVLSQQTWKAMRKQLKEINSNTE